MPDMGFFSRFSSKLPLEVVDEDGETACLVMVETDDIGG
jgi:hypothetical protein